VTIVAIRAAILVATLASGRSPRASATPSSTYAVGGAAGARRAAAPALISRSARHLVLTAQEIVVAYGLAVAGGLGVGFALGLNRVLGRAYGPILAALYAVPSVVWYPSLMLFFGLDAASKIAFGFLLGFFPVTLAVLAGIRQVNAHLVTVARSFGASSITVFTKVMVPGMLFTLMGGLRTGLALAVIGVIVGEILGSKSGMGSLINHAYGLFRTADYVALVIVTLVLIVATDALASLVERRARRWTG